MTRCSVDGDGRGAYAELTPAGLEKLRAARRTRREGVRAHFLDRLSATDQVALADIWARLKPR